MPDCEKKSLFFFVLFFILSVLVYTNNVILIALDERVYQLAASVAAPFFLDFFKYLTWLGASIVCLPLLLCMSFYIWMTKRKKEAFYRFGWFLFVLWLNQYLKLFFLRSRPVFLTEVSDTLSYSFPSGHALAGGLLAASLFWFLGEINRKKSRFVLATVVAFLVGISRIVLGVHWFSDVIGGVLLAVASHYLFDYFLYRKCSRRT